MNSLYCFNLRLIWIFIVQRSLTIAVRCTCLRDLNTTITSTANVLKALKNKFKQKCVLVLCRWIIYGKQNHLLFPPIVSFRTDWWKRKTNKGNNSLFLLLVFIWYLPVESSWSSSDGQKPYWSTVGWYPFVWIIYINGMKYHQFLSILVLKIKWLWKKRRRKLSTITQHFLEFWVIIQTEIVIFLSLYPRIIWDSVRFIVVFCAKSG